MFLSRQQANKSTPVFLPVIPGQKLLFLICLIGAAALLWLAPAAAYADGEAQKLDGTNYSIEIGGTGGTAMIKCYTLPGDATKWQYILQDGKLDVSPEQDAILTGAIDYKSDQDISVETGKHLILLATDYADRVKAYADITIEDTHIRVYDLKSPANYSAPEPGGAAGTTKITQLNYIETGLTIDWYYKIQSGAFPMLSLGDKVDGTYESYTTGNDIHIQEGQHLVLLAVDNNNNKIRAFADLSISSGQISKAVATLGGTIVTTETGEDDIRTGGKTLTITLTGNSWVDDLADEELKQNLLFDSLEASGTEKAEWDKVITKLKATSGCIALAPNRSTVTITFPKVAGYNITVNQTVKVSIPSSLLSYAATIKPAPQAFTVVAEKSASITGPFASAASPVTEADIRAGGKMLTITLVNDTWATDIDKDRKKSDALFGELKGPSGQPWNNKVLVALKASPNSIKRVNSTTVTITMPKVPAYNIDADEIIELKTIPDICLASKIKLVIPNSEAPSFTIKPVKPSAALSGSAVTAPTTEANIVAGGKTIIITLINDTWQDVVAGLADRLSAGGLGSEWTKVTGEIKNDPNSIVRTSDTVVTITLPAVPEYDITSDQTITVNLDGGKELTVENQAIQAVPPGFTIKPVTATVGGTAVTTMTICENIIKGGKTVVITLNNGEWAADLPKDATKVNKLIEGLRLSEGDNPGSPDAQWQKVRAALKAGAGKIKVSGSTLTITLPPVPDYFIQADQTVTVTVDNSLLKLPTADKFQAEPSFKIYTAALPPAAATVSFNPDLSVTDIKSGNATITIMLNNDTWVGDIVSNRNNLTKLIDGFTAASDTSQWELVKNTVKTSPVSVLSKEADNIITISLPAVSNYNIAADQTISVKIPKALLNLTRSDLAVTPSIIIKAEVKGDLDSMLQDGSLDTLLVERSPDDIYVNVPKKYISKIEMSNNNLGTTNLTSLSVQAEEEVNAVRATTGGVPHSSASYNVAGGKRAFSVAFSGLEKDTDVTVEAFSDTECETRLGKDVVVKVAPGNTVPYPPKGSSAKSLAGAYSLQKLISDGKLFSSILLQYGLDELTVTTSN